MSPAGGVRSYRLAGSLVLDHGESKPLLLVTPGGLTGSPARGHTGQVDASARAPLSSPAGGRARRSWLWSRRPRQRVYDLCGRPIEVRFASRELLSLVHPRFAHSETTSREPIACLTLAHDRDGYALLESGRPTIRTGEPEAMVGTFIRRYAELSYGRSDWTAVLHAAAVGDAAGRTMLVPGRNGSGKSTLVVALLASGYRYVTDDCVPLDGNFRIAPLPFAVCLKEGSWQVAAEHLPGVATAPVFTGREARTCRYLPVADVDCRPSEPSLIVFPTYHAAATPGLRRLDPIETLQRLVDGRAWLSRRPAHLEGMLGLLERLPAYALAYSSLDDALGLIATLPFGAASTEMQAPVLVHGADALAHA